MLRVAVAAATAAMVLLPPARAAAQDLKFDALRIHVGAGFRGHGLERSDPFNPGVRQYRMRPAFGGGGTVSLRASGSNRWGLQLAGEILPFVRLRNETEGIRLRDPRDGRADALYWVIPSAWMRFTSDCWQLCIEGSAGYGYGRYAFRQELTEGDVKTMVARPQTRGTWRVGVRLASAGISERFDVQITDHVATLQSHNGQDKLSAFHVITMSISATLAGRPLARPPANGSDR